MKNKSLLILVASFVLAPQVIFADKKQDASIFKCINNKEEVYYNDKPCPVRDKETKIRAVKDPANKSLTKAYSESPIFGVKKQKKVRVEAGKNTGESKFGNSNSQNKPIEELDGADAMLKAESERAERAILFAGASDADERRATQNDKYNNPPKGFQKPLGSDVNVIELTEEMAISRMKESADK